MKILSFLLLITGACTTQAQHLTYTEWHQKALLDMRLAPRFGDRVKNAEHQASDAEFIRLMLANDSVPRSASKLLVEHGFERLSAGDLTAAMYRFNQAFLMDSTNADIYWGYGTFFMELDRPLIAHTMFRAGLSVDSTHVELLTGEATAYLAEHHTTTDSTYARELMTKALGAAQSAARHNPRHTPALQRVVICLVHLGHCVEAKEAFQQYERIGDPKDVQLLGDLLINCKVR